MPLLFKQWWDEKNNGQPSRVAELINFIDSTILDDKIKIEYKNNCIKVYNWLTPSLHRLFNRPILDMNGDHIEYDCLTYTTNPETYDNLVNVLEHNGLELVNTYTTLQQILDQKKGISITTTAFNPVDNDNNTPQDAPNNGITKSYNEYDLIQKQNEMAQKLEAIKTRIKQEFEQFTENLRWR